MQKESANNLHKLIDIPSPSGTLKKGDIASQSDNNPDGFVNIWDYNRFLSEFGKRNDSVTLADFDDDDVDVKDYNILVTNFGS